MERLSFKFTLSTLASTAACFVLVAGISACSSRIDQRGNLPDPDTLANVEVGHINKQGVADLLGSPSSVGAFDGDTWYYISERTEKVAFFEPKVLERKVLVFRFDPKGVLSEMNELGIDDASKIEMVARKTPTAGNEVGVLRQIFGNLGRFDGAKGKSAPQ